MLAPEPEVAGFANAALDFLEPVYGAALRLTRNADSAQDLVQDTYLKVMRGRSEFAAGANLKVWLYAILHHTWRNRQRDGVRSRGELESQPVEQNAEGGLDRYEEVTAESLFLRGSLDTDLQVALDGLDEALREAVWLRDVDEFTYQEIAGVLQIPIGTVVSCVSRGRRQLYAVLTKGPNDVRRD
jgi:RNA polymerase sigma-70 factor (ECF subfamily)